MAQKHDPLKAQAAAAALAHVKDGMVLGLGTGSTAAVMVDLLAAKIKAENLNIQAIPTSEATRRQAVALGIEIIDPDETTKIDLVIDGADECDEQLILIKGGGGALLREKIIASAGAQMIVIADKNKRVAQLGKFPLPVEIMKFSWPLTIQAIKKVLDKHGLGHIRVALRPGIREAGGGVYLTDNDNYILDMHCGRIPDAVALHHDLLKIAGVAETGLFVEEASIAYFGDEDGVQELKKRAY